MYVVFGIAVADGGLEERDAHLRLVVVGTGQRRRWRVGVHFRVGVGRGQVDHDGRRARVGFVVAANGHHGRGSSCVGFTTVFDDYTAAVAASSHRRGRSS